MGYRDPEDDQPTIYEVVTKRLVTNIRRVREAARVVKSLPILLLLVTFLQQPFGSQSVGLSVRYISKRFSWKLYQTGFLLSLRALVNIILLLGIIPLISHILAKRFHYSPKAKDLLLAQVSAIFLVAGAAIVAASPNVVFTIFGLLTWTMGTAFTSLCRSLITTLVDKQHVGRLYSVIAMVETVGGLIAGPSLAGFFALGLKWKGLWIGLPFFAVAAITLIAGFGVWCFGCLTRNSDTEDLPYHDEEHETLVGHTVRMEVDTGDVGVINDV